MDVERYGSLFMEWWIALQLEWRLGEERSFKYEAPKEEDWSVLLKGGTAGIYTVIVALSWWVRALTQEISCFNAWKAVHDVQWVMDQICMKLVHASGKKRCREESGKGSTSLGLSKKKGMYK